MNHSRFFDVAWEGRFFWGEINYFFIIGCFVENHFSMKNQVGCSRARVEKNQVRDFPKILSTSEAILRLFEQLRDFRSEII